MKATWRYRTTTRYCSGTAVRSGLAQCTMDIGDATRGYVLNVDVVIGGFQVTTWFPADMTSETSVATSLPSTSYT